MSQRFKSSLYLAAFILASLLYYNETNTEKDSQTVEVVSSGIEQVSSIDGME